MENTNNAANSLNKFITPGTVVIFYLVLAGILVVFLLKNIPSGDDFTTIAGIGGIGVTLLLGLMGQNLTILNTREQLSATHENLIRQIESTEQLAEAQRAHTAYLADKQNEYNLELETLKAQNAILQQQFRMQEEKSRDKEKEFVTIRLKYLDPLRLAAEELAERINEIQSMLITRRELPGDHPDSIAKMVERFNQVKHPESRRPGEQSGLGHIYWSNGEGYFAMSSIYRTIRYFYNVNKVRREFPFGELKLGDDIRLIAALDSVRGAIGGYWGIFNTLQDATGEYIRLEDGKEMTYIQFCQGMSNEEDRAQILRVIDFYRDIHMKKNDERQQMIHSLFDLTEVVKSVYLA